MTMLENDAIFIRNFWKWEDPKIYRKKVKKIILNFLIS